MKNLMPCCIRMLRGLKSYLSTMKAFNIHKASKVMTAAAVEDEEVSDKERFVRKNLDKISDTSNTDRDSDSNRSYLTWKKNKKRQKALKAYEALLVEKEEQRKKDLKRKYPNEGKIGSRCPIRRQRLVKEGKLNVLRKDVRALSTDSKTAPGGRKGMQKPRQAGQE